jgi:hypothetical protein
MADVDEIKLVVSAEISKALEDLRDFENQAKAAAKTSGTFVDGLKDGFKSLEGPSGQLPFAFGKIAAGVGLAAGAVAGFIAVATKFSDVASEQDKAFTKLEAVAKGSGVSFSAAKVAAQELAKDGLITLQESTEALGTLLSTGISLPDAIANLHRMKDVAAISRQANYGLGESLVVYANGIKNQNSMNTDATGITTNYAKILEQQAAKIGKTVDQLNDLQKAQLAVKGFTEAAAYAEGQAAVMADSYSGAKSRAESASKSLAVAVGTVLEPVMQKYQNTLADLAGKAKGWFQSIFGGETLTESGSRLANEIPTAEARLKQLETATSLKTGKRAATDEEIKAQQELLSTLKEQFRVNGILAGSEEGKVVYFKQQKAEIEKQLAINESLSSQQTAGNFNRDTARKLTQEHKDLLAKHLNLENNITTSEKNIQDAKKGTSTQSENNLELEKKRAQINQQVADFLREANGQEVSNAQQKYDKLVKAAKEAGITDQKTYDDLLTAKKQMMAQELQEKRTCSPRAET